MYFENTQNEANKKKLLGRFFELKGAIKKLTNTSNSESISVNMMFDDYLKYWLEMKKDSVTATTYSGYYSMIYKRIAPYFEDRRLKIKSVKPSDIQNFYNLQYKRVSAATVTRYHNVIHAAFEYLLRLDLISSNPADRILLPKKQRYIANYYNEEELNMLFEVSKNHPLSLLIKVTASYGLRRSEVLGLKWSAIDFEKNTLTIKHVVTVVKINGKTQVLKEDRAKTQSSIRTLPLLNDIKELLLEQKKKQERNMNLCRESYVHEFDEYIFVDDIGNLFKPEYVTSSFRNLMLNNNLKYIRFHDLRHSCASLLLAHEVPMKFIQEWLGHSDIGTTANIYSHTNYKTKLVSAGVIKDTLNLIDSN